MNRRDFYRAALGATLGGAFAPSTSALAQGAGEGSAPYKLSVMLWTVFRKMPFEQRLDKVAEAGYNSVELVGEFRDWSDADYQRALAKKHELRMGFDTTAGLRHGVGDPSARDAFLADLRGLMPIADRLECPSIIVMSGNVVPGLSHEAQHQSCVEGLKRAAEMIDKKSGFELLLENIDPEENPKYFLTSVAEGFQIIEAVGHPRINFLYDFFHEQIAEGNLIEKLQKNIDKVGLVHIADVPGRHEPGTGEINYLNIYRKLAALNYNRYVAMEFLPTGDEVEALKKARAEALNPGRA